MEEKNINTKYLLLNTLHNKLDFLSQNNENSFQSENKIQNEYSENNILIKYIQDPNILFQDKSYFINCINELNSFLDNNETIIFPFLDICQKLVKAYIQYDLDEEKIEEYKYMHIFEKLVKNSFISKDVHSQNRANTINSITEEENENYNNNMGNSYLNTSFYGSNKNNFNNLNNKKSWDEMINLYPYEFYYSKSKKDIYIFKINLILYK